MGQYIQWAVNELGGDAAYVRADHGDQSVVYRLTTPHGVYFLKIGADLEKERARLAWLEGKLPVPKVKAFTRIESKDALLLTGIEGENLADLSKKWDADKVTDKLLYALKNFHAADTRDCPFGTPGEGKMLVHGDACLPNFIFEGDELSGYIDLGDVRVDLPEIDLSAAIWSLQYNLGPGYGLKFLEQYGIPNPTEELVEKLRLQYEEQQKEWGL